MHDFSRTVVLIPSYEPDEKLPKLLNELLPQGFMSVVMVDDGSGAAFSHIFDSCKLDGCKVIGYPKNRGKGFAMKTGFKYIEKTFPGFDVVVTADSDGQHTPFDICRVAEQAALHENSLILGSRNCKNENVPFKSRFGNSLTRSVFRFLTGVKIKDTQTGLRGFSKQILKKFSKTAGDRYEYEMRVLMECKHKNVPVIEIEIETVYAENNATTHFHPFKDSLRVYSVFGAHIFKFLFSSLFSTLIDWTVFTLLLYLVFHMQTPEHAGFVEILTTLPLLISFASARLLSSFVNFTINRKVVFKDKKSPVVAALKYYLLVIIIAALTYLLLSLFVMIGVPSVIAQPLATTILFLLSYYAQRVFVF